MARRGPCVKMGFHRYLTATYGCVMLRYQVFWLFGGTQCLPIRRQPRQMRRLQSRWFHLPPVRPLLIRRPPECRSPAGRGSCESTACSSRGFSFPRRGPGVLPIRVSFRPGSTCKFRRAPMPTRLKLLARPVFRALVHPGIRRAGRQAVPVLRQLQGSANVGAPGANRTVIGDRDSALEDPRWPPLEFENGSGGARRRSIRYLEQLAAYGETAAGVLPRGTGVLPEWSYVSPNGRSNRPVRDRSRGSVEQAQRTEPARRPERTPEPVRK